MPTILEAISQQKNDYSHVEKSFLKEATTSLVSFETETTKQNITQSVSIIIPCYNPAVLPLVLLKISEQLHRKVEVILVDDCSGVVILDLVKDLNLPFRLKIVRHQVNHGRPFSRNTGISLASGDTIIFLDQDMIVSPNFVSMFAMRQHFTDNCIFVGFRENIDLDAYSQNPAIKPKIEHDWRFFQPYSENLSSITMTKTQNKVIPNKAGYHLITESDFFKNFGQARKIGYWDLPTMIVSHSFSVKRSTLIKVGGFPELTFKGWGVEDFALGAILIANGQYIVPVVNCVSYHINHQRHSGSVSKEWLEFEGNFQAYKKFVNEASVDEMSFKHHEARFVKSLNTIDYYEF